MPELVPRGSQLGLWLLPGLCIGTWLVLYPEDLVSCNLLSYQEKRFMPEPVPYGPMNQPADLQLMIYF
jgi:hypothetical protein